MRRKLTFSIFVSFLFWMVCIMSPNTQNSEPSTSLPTQASQILPCIWINGRSNRTAPPIPTYSSEPNPGFFYHLSYPTRYANNSSSPHEVDFAYPNRLVSSESLENILCSYQSNILSPSESKFCYLFDQLSDENFLYYYAFNQNLKDSSGMYFLVNPYRKSSELLFSLAKNKSSPAVQYVGFLSNPSRFCFYSQQKLFIMNKNTKEIKLEAPFSQQISYFATDYHSLFIFLDSKGIWSAYSVKEHKVIWQNHQIMKDLKAADSTSNENFNIKASSLNDQWFLMQLPGFRFLVISSVDGKVLSQFSLPVMTTESTLPLREWFGSIWIQYLHKASNTATPIVRFIRIMQDPEKKIAITSFDLDNPYIDPKQQSKLQDANPVFYSFIPSYHKLLIQYRDMNNKIIQTVFEMP